MATPFPLEILTPEYSFFRGQAEGVIVMSPDGELCVLAGHVPLVTPLEIGSIRIHADGQWKEAFISNGFMEVGGGGAVIVAQACEWPENIDVSRAKAKMEETQARLRQETSIREHRVTQLAMTRAMARLRVTARGGQG